MFRLFCRRTDPATERKLDQIASALLRIARKLTTMSEQSDAMNKKVDDLSSSVKSIRQDITDIKNSLPASGGLSADEVAALSTKLDAVASDAAELDSENPAAPTT